MPGAGEGDRALLGWLKLARCRGLPPAALHDLAQAMGGVTEVLADAGGGGEPQWWTAALDLGLPEDLLRQLTGAALDAVVRGEVETVRQCGWDFLHFESPAYPTSLRHLSIPPPVLAFRGAAPALGGPAVAIVGSRHPSNYGLRMAADLAGGLAVAGLVVVSGLALGIDAAAHRAAVIAGGLTAAVMGTGPDRIYPAPNRRLADDIARQGVLLTEFPPGAPPLRDHFPRRNRIIAALADVVVVVEAAQRSGALITAGQALDLGRPVLAVPGRVGDLLAAGTLALLRDGAAPACTVADVLAQLPPDRRPALLPPTPTADSADPPEGEAGTETDVVVGPRPGLDAEAAAILEAIPEDDEIHVDAVLERLRRPTEQVLAALFGLQLAGLLEALPGGHFRRTGGGRQNGRV